MKLIDGRKFASYIYAELAPRIKQLREKKIVPKIVTILASDDAAMCTAQEFKVDAGWV